MKQIVVVGSLNLDRIHRVARLPLPGETVTARETLIRFGGKGANQAIAAARLGGRVALIGAVGDDEGGRDYRRRLREEGIETSGLVEKRGSATGSASIVVEDTGENTIIVDPGANGRLDPADVRAGQEAIRAAALVLLQLEVPLEATLEALVLAREAGVPVVLNPSPWRPDFPWSDVSLHTVIVNETEAAAWLGEVKFPEELALERLVVTQGSRPTLGMSRDGRLAVSPLAVRPVDTVGAGDAFAGAMAVALAEQQGFEAALQFANAAGGLATLAIGAQEALPTRAEVDAWRIGERKEERG
jgi:ribokinase